MLSSATDLFSLEVEAATPFRIATLVIFILAIIHTLFANHFVALADRLAGKQKEKKKVYFFVEILHFLGEIEVIFGLWVAPLLFIIFSFYNWPTAVHYLNTRSFVEPLMVVVVMTLASTRPIITLAEGGMWLVAQLFRGSVSAWWLTVLTIGPILGSFITEVGAMTICAMLLMRHMYAYNPSKMLAYATLGLLFVNISVGGLLTNFAAPPVLIVARIWDWSSWFMFSQFGWKALLGIIIANGFYFFLFRKDLQQLEKVKKEKELKKETEVYRPVPFWITAVHILFLVWVVFNAHSPAIFIGAFLIFIGFHQATAPHQSPLLLKRPMLVGMFLAGLVIHGGLQGWWIEPLLGHLTKETMMWVALILTPFNDNASITYLATLIPNLSLSVKYALVSGVIAGGGLTIIANAPNPAGQALLRRYFKKGVSPLYLFLAALLPTLILLCLFYFF
jgi:hypothetical protein